MGSVTGLTASRMQEIIDRQIVSAEVVGDHLILTRDDGSNIDAGNIVAAAPVVVDTEAELAALAIGDGIETYFAVSISTMWHLRYDLTNDRWHKIGGAPILTNIDASQSTSVAGIVDQDLATVGPSASAPLSGSYLVQVGSRLTLGGAAHRAFHSYTVAGAAALQSDSAEYDGASGDDVTIISPVKRKVLTIGDALVSKYRDNSGTQAATFADRWMKIDPEYLTTP